MKSSNVKSLLHLRRFCHKDYLQGHISASRISTSSGRVASEPAVKVASTTAAPTTSSSSRLQELRKRLSLEENQDANESLLKSSPLLRDKFERQHTYLRISVSERCNLRCTYCMPEEGVPLTPTEKLLSADEIQRVAKLFVANGVNKVRITGGEPTLRKDLNKIISNLSSLNLDSIGITTNGILLPRLLPDLLSAGVTHINLSLDSLEPRKFEKISRRPPSAWMKVWKGLELATELMTAAAQPFDQERRFKLNCVVMQGVNDDEICDFVELTKDRNMDVRFIEYMPFTGNKWDLNKMVSYQKMLEIIRGKFPDIEKLQDPKTHTSKAYRVKGHKGRVGFITSMSDHFCGGCNRLRITADGNLKVCLFGNAEVSLRDAIRNGASEEQLEDLIGKAVKRKHAKHAGMMNLKTMENRPMILIDSQANRSGYWTAFRNQLHHIPLTVGPTSQQLRAYCTTSKEDERKLSHVDSQGKIFMVDVTDKSPTVREAIAEAFVHLTSEAFKAVAENTLKKGDVLTVAQVAGILGAKQTSNLIPLCHPLPLSKVDVKIHLNYKLQALRIETYAKTTGVTGVEMEALTAAAVAALTVYDMCKAVDKNILVTNLRLLKKTGGKSDYEISGGDRAAVLEEC